MAKTIMIQGTMSSAGKSVLTAGLCRIFRQDGYRVAPFKSQNMALNSFITKDGLEMGRAQVMQAEAAGIEPSVLMNPILLKPSGHMGSQVIVNGEVVGNMTAADYFQYKRSLVPKLMEAFHALSDQNDIIVIEGAGSPAEINLKAEDIVNMGMAKLANAPVLLAGDIDRGGVFASLYGTVALLEPEEQARIKGLIINKFRGDVEILKPGLTMLEDLTHISVLGVVPYLNLDLEDEDSLAPRLEGTVQLRAIDIAVVRLPHIANFTDFNALERFDCASVRYVKSVGELGTPDFIILPGTKNTMADLLWLRQNGLEAAVCRLVAGGTPLLGICGGYQMLGKMLSDPYNMEHGGTLRGMGLLDTETVFAKEKTRTQVTGRVEALTGFFAPLSGCSVAGYEIHMGQTHGGSAFAHLDTPSEGRADGAVCGNVLGSYLHGLFDEGSFAQSLIDLLLGRKGISGQAVCNISFAQHKEQQYDALAAALRSSLDMQAVYRILNEGANTAPLVSG
ncbi:MAG: cobyric acid synthase [Angelakisella sp.]